MRFAIIIGGKKVGSPTTFLAHNLGRLDNNMVGEFAEATGEQVQRACETAREVFGGLAENSGPYSQAAY